MLIKETAKSAWRSLASNRLRTLLTMLGMIIGTAAVVAVLGIGEGARSSVEGRIRSLGANLLMVRPGSASAGGVRSGTVRTLTEGDAEALRGLDGVAAVAPERSGSAQLRYMASNLNASVTGITPAYLEVRSIATGSGVPFSDLDVQQRARVALIGANVARQLYPGVSPLGTRLQINGNAFRVVGVLAEKGSGMGSPDDGVFVPMSTHESVLFGQDHLSTISLQLASEDRSAQVIAQLEQLLRLRHRLGADQPSDFEVRSQAEMLETMGQITGTFTTLLGSVAAVSLIVGGIGIMNIMLVSVRERTREIGVRMAVGARRRDILRQFLVEAVVVSLAGGVAGVGLGYGAAVLLSQFGQWATIVPPYAIGLALGVSVLIGVTFGVGPARRAARLDPVEALRFE
ncbi:multidrug ABC transporter substrate-binding protein [Sorangium cellulosum]|uniref:Multidrug ABC transporter substrate-binding protein n=1 Tax=Sorangium cellulosum TaxID=56 RepID=A0A2L0EZ56_SORCE|nr:ABC transporter permease [Sorangium cellulosum]AUX44597.1 multidrug ABC transporter substrate-binding protein [Sorangium cellulosum]